MLDCKNFFAYIIQFELDVRFCFPQLSAARFKWIYRFEFQGLVDGKRGGIYCFEFSVRVIRYDSKIFNNSSKWKFWVCILLLLSSLICVRINSTNLTNLLNFYWEGKPIYFQPATTVIYMFWVRARVLYTTVLLLRFAHSLVHTISC